jgi:prevent-host-death family protein
MAINGHMKTVNIAELKNRLSLYLDEVRAGREVLVRDRNRPIARIVPITHHSGHDDELRALAAQGKIRLAEEEMDEGFWNLPAPRVSTAALRRTLERERRRLSKNEGPRSR